MKERLLALLHRHEGTLRSDMQTINARLETLEHLSDAELTTLHREVHTLKGSSGSLGFDQVFAAAEGLEKRLKIVLGHSLTSDDCRDIRQLTGRLDTIVAAARIQDSNLVAKFGLQA